MAARVAAAGEARPVESPTPAEMLHHHGRFVRALAQRLLGDPHRAEDAAQDTWLRYLDRPPATPRAPRAWLARVLRNEVRMRGRGDARRARREVRAARAEGQPGTARSVMQAETLRRVAEAVYGLREPYRSAVLLRYFEDLPPRVIARRLDLPLETVKSRLKRGLAQLRDALDTEGRDMRRGLAALAGAAWPWGSWMGAVFMTGKSIAAGVLVVGALTALVVWGWPAAQSDVAHDPSGTTAAQDLHADPAETPSAQLSGSTPVPDASSQPVAPPDRPAPAGTGGPERPAPPKLRTYQGRVTVDGAPPASSLHIRPGWRAPPLEIDAQGRFRFEAAEGKSFLFLVGEDEKALFHIRAPLTEDHVEIALAAGTGRIHGTVYDAQGGIVADARLTLYAQGAAFEIVALRTDEHGRFDAKHLPAGSYVLVTYVESDTPGRSQSSRSATVKLDDGEVRQIDIGQRAGDPRWSGRVRFADGAAPGRAGNIFLKSDDGARHLYVGFDAEGRFSELVPPGAYRIEFVLSGGTGMQRFPRYQIVSTHARLNIEATAVRSELEIPGERLQGSIEAWTTSVRHPQHIRIERMESDATEPAPKAVIGAGTSGPRNVTCEPDGTFEILGLTPGLYALTGTPRALAGDAEGRVFVRVAAGDGVVPVTVRLATPR